MVKKILNALGILSVVASISAAQADPVTTQPDAIAVNGNVTVVFIASGASDISYLSLVGGPQDIFCNFSTSGCQGAGAGDAVDLGVLEGNLVFQLRDITVPQTYDTANKSSDDYYHVKIASSFADLNLNFSMPDAAADVIASLLTPTSIVRYVGFEDRDGGDYDYNDFVFAVVDPPTDPVPEPASLFLLGAGLAGVAARRRRKA